MQKWWALLVAVIGAIILAIVSTTPPGPVSADAPATAFSAARAMVDDRVIGKVPHPTGSPEDAQVRDYLVSRLRSMGLEVTTTQGTMDPDAKERLDVWRGSPAAAPPLTNIVATLPGTDRAQPAVLLMAHHDSVWGSPGAADDGAGVASLLETVRAIKAGAQPRRDLMVLLTDGEELGLEGAKSFFANDPRRTHVGVIVNAETRGGGGRASMFETGDQNGAMMQLFGASVSRPVGTSLSTFIYKKLPNSTDYTIAKKVGVPGFNFAFIGRPAQYHSPTATPDALDQGALQDMGRQVLALTRGLVDAPALPGKAPDRVFFDAFGLFFVGYPAGLGWLILIVAAASYGAAEWRRTGISDVLRGAVVTLALIVTGGVLLYVVNLVSGSDAPVNYYDRLAAIPRLEWQALSLCVAAFALLWGMITRWWRSLTGIALPLLLLGLFVQLTAPTAAYPIAVPLMLGGLAAALTRYTQGPWGRVATVVAAMLGVGYMLGFGFFLLEAVGPGMPMIAAVPLAISAVLVVPLMPEKIEGEALIAGGVLILAAMGIALWVRLDALAPSVAVYSVSNGIH